jgi:hypothetical protein
MASIVENEKGFKVIKLSEDEARFLGWGVPEGIICMGCNEIIKGDIYFPCVLNDTFDKDCYEEWIKEAKYYPEDSKFEDRVFNYLKELLML